MQFSLLPNFLAQAFFFLKMTAKKGIGTCLRSAWDMGNTVTEMFL